MAKIEKIAEINPIQNAISGLEKLVNAWQENNRITNIEKTKRKNIEAQKEVILEKIKQDAKILRKYMNKAFDEREKNFDKLFDTLDNALEKNNIEAMGIVASKIVEIAKVSPLYETKKLIDDFNNPNVQEIEI